MSEDVGLGTVSPAHDGENNNPPPQIPDHTIIRKIGAGKYGEVWLAQNIMGDYRAVKVVYRSNFQEARPFDREFEGLKAFSKAGHHPSQVSIYHVGRNESEDYFYCVMDLADDQVPREQFDPKLYAPRTIRSELDKHGHLSPEECVKIALPLTAALEHLHGRNLIHRDIKPANVIFVSGQPKLADIGLVTAANEEGTIVGTPAYLAPEGSGTAQSDIFSIGKVLYEMLTGLAVSQYPTLPADWSSKPHRLAQDLNLVVAKACEPNPHRRYRTTEELRKELAILEIGDSLRSRRKRENFQQQFRRYGPWLIVILVAVFASLGAFIFKRRAGEQEYRRELRELRLERLGRRQAGWFVEQLSRQRRAAQFRLDDELVEQATAALSGVDARTLQTVRGLPVASAAFAPDGRILMGGAGEHRAVLIETNGTVTELPSTGEGPVCWTPAGEPRQLEIISNEFVLRNPVDGQTVKRILINSDDSILPPHNPVLALSRDGNLFAASVGKKVSVFRATGKLLCELSIDVSALAFSPDGSLLGAGCRNGAAHVYSTQDFHEAANYPPAARGTPILCLAFGRDARVPYDPPAKTNLWLLATGDQGAGIVIWDSYHRSTTCRGSVWNVEALTFNPDSTVLASAGQANSHLWDTTTGEEFLSIAIGGPGDSKALAYDREGQHLVGGGDDGVGTASLRVCDIQQDHGIHALRGLGRAVRKVWFSKDSQLVAALSDDWQLAIWNLNPSRLRFVFQVPLGDSADSAGGCFSNNGEEFAFATSREARLYNLISGETQNTWQLKPGLCDQLQYDSNGRLLLLREEKSLSKTRKIWRLYALAPLLAPESIHEQDSTNWSSYALAFAPDADWFVVRDSGDGRTKQRIHVYDTQEGRELTNVLSEWEWTISWNPIDPSGQRFGYRPFGGPHHQRLVSVPDFRDVGTGNYFCTATSSTGAQFCSGWLYPDPARPKYSIRLGMDGRPSYDACSFSPDGRYVAWGTEEGPVLVANILQVQQRLAELH